MPRGKNWTTPEETTMRNCMRDAGDDRDKGFEACVNSLPGRTINAVKTHWSIMANPRKKAGKVVPMRVVHSPAIEARKARLFAMIEEGFTDTTCITDSPEGITIKF